MRVQTHPEWKERGCMTHDDNIRGNNSSPSSRSGPDGHHSPPPTDEETHGTEQPELRDSGGVGGDIQRTGQINADDTLAKHGDTSPEAVEPEVYDAEPVTRGELTQVLSTIWYGPTPSPETLAAFAQVNPSFAERAFAMSERSLAASTEEKLTLAHGDVDAVRRGQYLSFALSIICFFAAGALFWISQNPWLAGLPLAPPVFQYFGKMIRTVRDKDTDKVE